MEMIIISIFGFGLAYLFHSVAKSMSGNAMFARMIAIMGLFMLSMGTYIIPMYIGNNLILHMPEGESDPTVRTICIAIQVSLVFLIVVMFNYGGLWKDWLSKPKKQGKDSGYGQDS